VPVGSYEYDGFKLLKENVDKNGGIDTVLQIIRQRTAEYGFPDLVWVCKQFKEFNDLTEWVALVQDTEKEDEEFKKVCDVIKRTYNRGDAGAVEFVNEMFPNHFVYSLKNGSNSKQGTWYCWDGLRWRSNDLPLRNAITYHIEKKMEEMLLPFTHYKFEPIDKDDVPNANQKLHQEITEIFDGMVKRICNANDVNDIVSMARQKFVDYNVEFDVKPYLLGFENGVLDLENRLFRPYHYEDRVSLTCGYDFTPYNKKLSVLNKDGVIIPTNCVMDKEDEKAMKKLTTFFEEIQPVPENRKYVKIIQGSMLIGVCIQKFIIYNGRGRNGKGMLKIITKNSLGGYVVDDLSSSVYTELRKNSGGVNPEIAKINKARGLFSEEPPKKTPLENSVIKQITGGAGGISARMCHSNDTKIVLHNTTIMNCNEKPPFAETPIDADTERIDDIEYPSFFTDDVSEVDNVRVFKKDATLENLFAEDKYKNAYINLILDDTFELMEEKLAMDKFRPESIKMRSLEYLNKSNDVNNLFLEAFEFRIEENKDNYLNSKGEPFDADWTLPSIAMLIRSGRTSFHSLPKKVKDDLKKEKIIEFFQTNKIYKKMVKYNSGNKQYLLQGWRLKKVEVDEDDGN
jgi:phage/plasmid-associated DNA primase